VANSLILVVIAALLMSGGATLLWQLGRQVDKQSVITRRLDQKVDRRQSGKLKANQFSLLLWLDRYLQRSDLKGKPLQLWSAVLVSMLTCTIGVLIKGQQGLLIALAAVTVVNYGLIIWKAAATKQMLLKQLPGFIDHIIRIMAIGRSFDSALLLAIQDAPAPLSDALASVVIEQALGGDLVESLQNVAELYLIKELQLITMALRINQRYGGSIKAMLENIITMLRQREQAQRELRALTGETRLSAWMLGTMPILLAGYMMITNPGYIGYLLTDPHGMEIIYTALGLQTAGGLILWRMMRSIR